MENALSRLATIAGLGLFVGIGVLAFRIGDTWTEATTQAMVTSIATICGGGAVLIAVLVTFVLGIPMAIRYFGEAGRARQAWDAMPPPPRRVPQIDGYTSGPPMLTAHKNDMGTWQSGGMGNYDLWEDEEPTWDEPSTAAPPSNRRGRLI